MSSAHLLDHVTVCARNLEETVRFYTELIGLEAGDRPELPFPGAWLYAGDRAVIHLIGDSPSKTMETGAIDHIAFRAAGADAFIAKCESAEIPYRVQTLSDIHLRQVFVHDPNGVYVELNFPGEG